MLIGLMMIKDEEDMLAESLANHSSFCDAILILDGTQGDSQQISQRICRSFSKVVGYWRDQDTGYAQPLRDGARRFLLEQARARWGRRHWYAVLHGDELWATDPKPFLEVRSWLRTLGYQVQVYHFFPHTSQSDDWHFVSGESSIEAQATHYMLPYISEERLFFDAGFRNYRVTHHSRVIPKGSQSQPTQIVIKQFNYRSPYQAHKRYITRKDSAWQINHYQHLSQGVEQFFVDSLANKNYKWAGCVPLGQGSAVNLETHPLPMSINSSK